MDENSGLSHWELGLTYLHKKQFKQAIAVAEKLITLSPRGSADYTLLAFVYSHIGRQEEAIEILENAGQAAVVIPAWRYYRLGDSYRLSGRQSEAATAYKSVFDHSPSHKDAVYAHIGLAILYVELGNEEEARAEAVEVLKLVPSFSVEVWGQRIPYKDPAQTERDMASLRKAGLK